MLTRIVIANPMVADIEPLNDQPSSRLLNIQGKMSGTTTLTLWDQTDRPVSFLVRVTIDTRDLESRIRQAFPGADVKVRQVGPQIILDGQVPDSKTMADVLQVVTMTLMSSQLASAAAMAAVAAVAWAAAGWRWWRRRWDGGGGGMGGGGMGGGGMGGGGVAAAGRAG